MITLSPGLHEVHQDRLLARADGTADRAERAVRAVWKRLLAEIQQGLDRGPAHWLTTFQSVRSILRSLPDVAHAVTSDLVQVCRDSAHWTAANLAKHLPKAHRETILRRKGLLENETDTGLRLEVLLPPLEEQQILAVIYQAGWLQRLQALTRLAEPDALAGQIASSIQRGLTIQQIAREIRPQVQDVQTSARRVARTAGLWVAHEAELQTYDEMGDMIEGYRINAVLDHATRPEHRKRDGTVYHCRPKQGQLGLDKMPRPPREADGSWSFNCRCWLEPILAKV